MSQVARDLPKKSIKLKVKVNPLCCHPDQSATQHDHTRAVKFIAKMVILILANHCGLLEATFAPSSQMQYGKLVSNHNRSAASLELDVLAHSDSSQDNINIFEWPRLKKVDGLTSGGALLPETRNDSLLVREPYEFEGTRKPSVLVAEAAKRKDTTTSSRLNGSNYQLWPKRRMDESSHVSQRSSAAGLAGDLRQTALAPALVASKPPAPAGESTKLTRFERDDDSRTNRSTGTDEKVGPVPNGPLMGGVRPQDELESADISAEHQQVDVAESKRIEQNPECALILKRTYILKGSPGANLDEWGDKFVFNDVDPEEGGEQRQHKVHRTDLCIKHSDVDKALEEAKHRIKFQQPADLNSFEVAERSLASIGELNLATGLLLTKRFELSHDEIMNALPMIDMSASEAYWRDLCPKHVRPMVCTRSRYRTITAHCNNLKHPSWGASKTPYSRYLPPDYADGLSAPRAAHNGEPLPSARLITSIVHQDSDEPSQDYSVLFADWGQLLNHDVTRVAVGEAPDCCPHLLKGLCMPIPVPPGDPLYSKHNVKCLKFERSLAAIRPKCLLGQRAQINLITSPVDASFIYGSTKQQAQKLRAFVGGKLRAINFFAKHQLKPLLPPKLEEPDKDCVARPKHLFCFEAGDVRVNEQTHLTVLHTIYLREHNRIAKQLAKLNMEWDDDKIYHETRHIVAACVQHVMANEFLPLLLGKHHVDEYKIMPSPDGYWNGYDASVTISTGTAFASAAFRYGHSMIEGAIRRLDPKSGAHIKSDVLRHLFKRPFWLYEPGAVDQLIAGMLLTPAEQTDPWVSEELSGHLFQPPKAKFGHDLAAINIQRGKCQMSTK